MPLRGVALALGLMLVCLTLAASPAHAAPEDFLEACSNGIAVPDPEDSPGLVQDCAVLLSIRDTLAGDATLDWSADQEIDRWEGITVDGRIGRVSRLSLNSAGLTGTIPEAVGDLTGLRSLTLSLNSLQGSIPASIGRLSGLEYIDLASNELSGEVPLSMWGLQDLVYLYLSRNRLTGHIPEEVGDLRELKILALTHNAFSGPLPQTLTQLPGLESLQVLGNHFSCSPRGLRRILDDVDYIDLPLCTSPVEPKRASAAKGTDTEPAPGATGTGLAPTPHGAVPIAVNVSAVLATALAILGIVVGLRTRYRP